MEEEKIEDDKIILEERLWKQFSFIRDARSSQDSVLWNIFSTFWASNAILLVALFSTGDLPKKSVGITISIVGGLLSIAWHKIQKRTLINISRLEFKARRLEEKLEIPYEYSISLKRENILTKETKEIKLDQDVETNNIEFEYLNKKMKARDIMKLCSLLASGMWMIAAIVLFIYGK